ncbi:MAG: S8 family serine peptidase [Chloroflexota bacterium]
MVTVATSSKLPMQLLIVFVSLTFLLSLPSNATGPHELDVYQSVSGQGALGLYRVALRGPAQGMWLEAFQQETTSIIAYLGQHTYLVQAHKEQISAIQHFDFVQSVTPYEPSISYKPSAQARNQAPIQFALTVIDNANIITQVISAIEAVGGQVAEQEKVRMSDPFVTLHVVILGQYVDQVSQIDGVLWGQAYLPPQILPVTPKQSFRAQQATQTNLYRYQPWTQTFGLNGQNTKVALIDTGFDTGRTETAHPDLRGRLIALSNPVDQIGHGTHVGGVIAGNASLNIVDENGTLMGLGVAPQATLIARSFYGTDTSLAKQVRQKGATISNHSYAIQTGKTGYTNRNRTIDALVRDAIPTTNQIAEPLTMVYAAGNFGYEGLGIEAKNIIAVGSTRIDSSSSAPQFFVSDFSSRGPTVDGRVFPHLVALGENVISTASSQSNQMCSRLAQNAPETNPTYSVCSGTSISAPHVSGALALLSQWWQAFNAGQNPSPAMAKALLVNGADDLNTPDIPNIHEGWGQLNVSNVIDAKPTTLYFDQTHIFEGSGQTWQGQFTAIDPGKPIKVTLAWTDAPGAVSSTASPVLVNDLDLVLEIEGKTYYGNHFSQGLSLPGGVADHVDNLENIFLPGTKNNGEKFTVKVVATAIQGNGIPYNDARFDQDFALVIQNAKLPQVYFGSKSQETTIDLSWRVAQAGVYDQYRLMRAEANQQIYEPLATISISAKQKLDNPTFYFRDDTASADILYDYRLEAITESGARFSYGPLRLKTNMTKRTLFPLYLN